MFELVGRVALVTGAGQGMGVGIAAALAAQEAQVAVNDLDPARAEGTAADLRAGGAQVVAAPFDVTDPEAVAEGVARAVAALGQPVDILVNNAGVPAGMALAPFRQLDPADWARYVDLNLYGSLHCTRAVLDPMCEQGWGRVVQISSAAARVGMRVGLSLYGASKSAVEGFVRHLSQEVARSGVTVNTVALGLMANAVAGVGDDAAVIEMLAKQVPVGRLGEPGDVGALVAFLASDEAAWLTGQTLALNGGQLTS
jgi:NAD(P)-dependent dehydrogenase (short-subunit alcohol dehydrogenase family)